uniref:2-methoxy-6-polyprenyl-1,4-benzoquinol methylase, mitochondrial n=1 Tax=Gossypium raimondii TaxID=29730 RepID=A0A0D2SZT7_GOSRA|nr:hypothetical protein B456_006G178500 [Gossypium raimondii]
MALRLVTKNLSSRNLPKLCSTCLLHSHATSFGFKQVREEEKSQMIGKVFSNVASNYDLTNDFMSGGLHRLWKDRLVSKLSPFLGIKHLDIAGGTGRLFLLNKVYVHFL